MKLSIRQWLLVPLLVALPYAAIAIGENAGILVAYLLIGIVLRSPLIVCGAIGLAVAPMPGIEWRYKEPRWQASLVDTWLAVGLLFDCAYRSDSRTASHRLARAMGLLLLVSICEIAAEWFCGLIGLAEAIITPCITMPIPLVAFAIVWLLTDAIFHRQLPPDEEKGPDSSQHTQGALRDPGL